MTTSTTSAIWRSTGGDQTRTASAGSMVMSQPFYIANVAVTGNVSVSTVQPNVPVILPAGAVVISVINNSAIANATVDLGVTPLIGVGPGQNTTLGTKIPQALLANASVATPDLITVGTGGAGTALGVGANATNLTVVVNTANTGTTGAVSGVLTYFVADPTSGEENV